jgi:hypothetical protein
MVEPSSEREPLFLSRWRHRVVILSEALHLFAQGEAKNLTILRSYKGEILPPRTGGQNDITMRPLGVED